MPKLKIDLNTHDMMLSAVHGYHDKELIVFHETVSPDIRGMADIKGNAEYLDRLGYGLYGCVDREGFIAAALGLGKAVFYTQGGENERGIGIELVSPIPGLLEQRVITKHEAETLWKGRLLQLQSASRLAACLSAAHDIPLSYVSSCHPDKGVCAHWNVSQKHPQSEGHTDCWPIQADGYFPINYIIYHARQFLADGLRF